MRMMEEKAKESIGKDEVFPSVTPKTSGSLKRSILHSSLTSLPRRISAMFDIHITVL